MYHTHETISGYFKLFLLYDIQGICENSPLKIQIFTLFIHKATILFNIISEMIPEL